MKTLIASLIAALALVVPASALADGGTDVAVSGVGTLSVAVVGFDTNATFTTDTPTPVLPDANLVPQDISNYPGDWHELYVNVHSCTRVVFGLANVDTGWHCVSESEGHPTSPITQSYTADQVTNKINLADDVGYDCTFTWACQNPKLYNPVDLSPYTGIISGLIFSDVCTDLDLSPEFGQTTFTTLGCSGTVTSTAGASLMASCVAKDHGCNPPKPFRFKNRKHKARATTLLHAALLRTLH